MSQTDFSAAAFGRSLFDELSAEAAAAPRLRKNRNFHRVNEDPAHRLLNATEPGTYVQPHRHADKDETLVVVRGRLGLVLFEEGGQVAAAELLEAGGELVGANLPAGTYHSLVSLEPGTIFFESKAGPYRALSAAEVAPWAPAEGEAASGDYLASLRGHFPG